MEGHWGVAAPSTAPSNTAITNECRRGIFIAIVAMWMINKIAKDERSRSVHLYIYIYIFWQWLGLDSFEEESSSIFSAPRAHTIPHNSAACSKWYMMVWGRFLGSARPRYAFLRGCHTQFILAPTRRCALFIVFKTRTRIHFSVSGASIVAKRTNVEFVNHRVPSTSRWFTFQWARTRTFC